MKTCTQCLESKDESLFARSSQARDGLHTWCRLCKANAARVWWGKNSDRENEKDRRQYAADGTRQRSNALTWHRTNRPRSLENKRAWKLAQYGLTTAQREEMYRAQSGRCAVCRGARESGDLKVDHDHATGVIRGLLCHACNVGLGHFMDSPSILTSAAWYLERHRKAKSA